MAILGFFIWCPLLVSLTFLHMAYGCFQYWWLHRALLDNNSGEGFFAGRVVFLPVVGLAADCLCRNVCLSALCWRPSAPLCVRHDLHNNE
eukprot:2323402-Amphidinium_carterae.1